MEDQLQELEQLDPVLAALTADVEPAGRKPAAPAKPERPVDYDAAAKRLMDRCIADARQNAARLDRDRADYLNLLFHRGGRDNQWVVYDRTTNTYVPRGTDPATGGLPEWVPRAVTNKFAKCIDGIVSILNQSEPAKVWYPSTDDDADRAAAEVAGDADPVLLDEIGYDAHKPELNKLVTLTSAAAYVVYYDTDPKHGMEDLPLFQCPGCGLITTASELEGQETCPGTLNADGSDAGDGCGAPVAEFGPALNPDGTPQGIPTPKGKLCAQPIPSFEFSLPSNARVCDAARVPWVLTHSAMSREEIISRWGAKAQQALDAAAGSKNGGIQASYARAMRQLSSPTRANAPDLGTAGTKIDPTVYILQHDPLDDDDLHFPKGLHAVMVEGVLLESGPLPVEDDFGRSVKTILIRTFTHSPGTPFGKPPADDLVPLQTSRNMVDSLIQLSLMHYAAPRTFIPMGVTLENQPTGRPGEIIYYRSMMPGESPTTERGTSPAEGLYTYLEIIDRNFDELSKLNSVLVGERPEGQPTLGEVQILQERGMAAFKEPLDELVRFERQLSKLCLWIARGSAWSDRFRQIRGENGQWEISQFNAADLTGKVDVQIDKTSAWPKSPLMKQMRLTEALKLGVLPPPQLDPELQGKLLTEFDLAEFKPSWDVDRKQIARELDHWKAAALPEDIQPPDPVRHNLPLHLHFKQQFLKTEEFEALMGANLPVAQAMLMHVQQVQMMLAQQQAAAAAAANPQPPQEDTRTPAEKGESTEVDDAIASGALQPAGAAPKADPMADAINAGALMPAGAMPQPPAGPSIDDLMAAGAIAPAPQESPAP